MNSNSCRVTLQESVNCAGRLVCFHHAGGSARFFQNWPDHFGDPIAVEAVELPGRGRRFGEPIPDTLEAAAGEIVPALRDRWSHQPVVFFGHSLGGALAWEVARQLLERDCQLAHFIVSSSPAPHLQRQHERHRLSDSELRQELRAMEGTPSKVLENSELMELFLPVIRADFKLFETYELDEPESLGCPVTALAGDDEGLEKERLRAWEAYADSSFVCQHFPGGHFYLEDSLPEVVDYVKKHLNSMGPLEDWD